MPLLTLFFLELGGPWVGAVGERYYCCVYFLSAISFHVRTYADASFHIFVPLVESGICLLVDVATLSTIRKRPSLLSLACASGRLSFAVGERYYCCV